MNLHPPISKINKNFLIKRALDKIETNNKRIKKYRLKIKNLSGSKGHKRETDLDLCRETIDLLNEDSNKERDKIKYYKTFYI